MELGKRKRFLVTRYSTSVSGYLCRGRVAFQSYKMLILLAFIASGFYLFRGSIESFFLLASKTSPAWLMTRLGQFLFLRDRISLIYRLGQFFFFFFWFYRTSVASSLEVFKSRKGSTRGRTQDLKRS